MLRHLRQWSKNFGFGSALSHNSGAANTILFTIQTFNEHSRMAKLSQPYLRGHMRWNVTSLQVQLGLIGTYNFGRLSTLKSNILSTRKLRVLWPIVWHRGLHGADFQPQIQSIPFSWIQIHSTPNSKINGASIPIHMKVRSIFTCIVLKYKQCLCLMLQIWHIFLNHCCILGIWPCFCVAYVMFYKGSVSIVSF